jgi:hypothetical protein
MTAIAAEARAGAGDDDRREAIADTRVQDAAVRAGGLTLEALRPVTDVEIRDLMATEQMVAAAVTMPDAVPDVRGVKALPVPEASGLLGRQLAETNLRQLGRFGVRSSTARYLRGGRR